MFSQQMVMMAPKPAKKKRMPNFWLSKNRSKGVFRVVTS